MRTHPAFRFLVPCVFLLLAAPVGAATPDSGSGTGHLQYLGTFTSPLLAKPPSPPPGFCPDCEKGPEEPAVEVPIDPNWNPDLARPRNPAIDNLGPLAPLAPGDFTIFRNNQTIGPAVNAAATTSTTDEPSLGVERNVIFYTGNWYAAISRDGGNNWSYISPYTTFPAPPAADAGGFCCDQVAYYDPQQDILVWLLQYSRDGGNTHNIQRIAVANGLQATTGNPIQWKLYRTAPEDFGLANTGLWVDFPDLAAGNTWLYSTTNIFTTPGNAFSQCVIYRMRLADLANNNGGNIYYEYFRTNEVGSWRMVQGSTNIMYFASHKANTQLKLWMWPDVFAPGQIVSGILTHAGFNTGAMVATGPDGRNYAQGADTRILGAYVLNPDAGQNTFLGFMWNAAQGNGYNFPYTRIVGDFTSNIVVNGSSAANTQLSLWNDTFAFLYPTVTPNARGDLGGLIHEGGGIYQPEARAYIADGGDWNNWESSLLGTSTNGPPIPTANNPYRWGDYVTVRRNWCNPNTWNGATFIQSGAPANAVTPISAWFGRERDTPLADVQVSDVQSTGDIYMPGDMVPTGASVINIGAQASGAISLDFRLSADTLIDLNDYPLGVLNVAALNASDNAAYGFNGTVPQNVPDGVYYLGVIASSGDECWLGNNIAWSTLPITITQQPVATLLGLFDATPGPGGVALRFRLTDPTGFRGVNIYRRIAGGAETRLTTAPIALDGRPEYGYDDPSATPGASYTYRLGLVKPDGSEVSAGTVLVRVPALAWALGAPQPNPSRGGCRFTLSVPRDADVRARVLDASGRLVAVLHDGPIASGDQSLQWNGRSQSGQVARAGVYFVTCESGGWKASRRIAVIP